jgi:hypothetical protein
MYAEIFDTPEVSMSLKLAALTTPMKNATNATSR